MLASVHGLIGQDEPASSEPCFRIWDDSCLMGGGDLSARTGKALAQELPAQSRGLASWKLFPGPRLPPDARTGVRDERSRRGFPACRGALAPGVVRGCARPADSVQGPAPAGCVVRADARAHAGCQPFPDAAFLVAG